VPGKYLAVKDFQFGRIYVKINNSPRLHIVIINLYIATKIKVKFFWKFEPGAFDRTNVKNL